MATASAGSDILEHYPELQFLLHFSPPEPLELPPHSDEEMERFVKKIHLDGVDILYIFGVGLGAHYEALKNWLHEKRDRRLIFLEDDLAAIAALVQTESSLFSDPQVVLHFFSVTKKIDEHLEELAATYPCDRIEVAAIESYQKTKTRRFQQMRLKLLRKSAVSSAILTESLYSHQMLINVLSNIKQWDGAFFAGGLKGKFKGIPAVICGAGPSLQPSLPLLKTLEDKALIIAGGSTLAALSNQGIQPHIGLALDPNAEEFDRLKISSTYETPLLFATRLQPDVFNTFNGERGYLVTSTGGPCEHYFEKKMEIASDPIGPELGLEAFSVTTLAVALAVELGCNPILLNGVDLAYTGMQRYAEGILPSSRVEIHELRKQKQATERLLKRKDIHGHFVPTLVKWVMESECIAAYARAHPQKRFINVSQEGIGFPGLPNIPLAEVIEHDLTETLDLRALVHAEIQQLKMPPLKEKISLEMQSVEMSLNRLKEIALQMIQELERVQALPFSTLLPTGKMTLLEIDFQEEKAFECLFPTVGASLDKLLSRAFYFSPNDSEEEKHRFLIESKIAKWKHWKEMIESEIITFYKCIP